MNSSKLPLLQRTANDVVRSVSGPHGLLSQGKFTMGWARRTISEKLGLGEEGLEDSKWKKEVKAAVQAALDDPSLEEEDTCDAESGPSKQKESKKGKARSREEPVSESSASPPPKSKAANGKGTATSRNDFNEEDEEEPQDSIEDDDDAAEKRREHAGDKSESEMSSVYDVPPARGKAKGTTASQVKTKAKRKSGAGDDSQDEERPTKGRKSSDGKRKKKDPNEGLSPEEAKVADLKRIVVACGTRKQWSKEFADITSPRDQKRHLEQILRELGMKGAPSLGKAKALKERRELAAELNDVREFESKRGLSAPERRASRSGNQSVDPDEEEDESSVDKPKEESALSAVMDFLGDDSD